jgi:ribosome biogenesis GTPase
MAKKKKIRVEMRKNRTKPARQRDWTRGYQQHGYQEEATTGSERVRAKGDLSRHRTIVTQEQGQGGAGQQSTEMPTADLATCLRGRVIRVHGLFSLVETEDGRAFKCTVRRLLRSLTTDERSILTCGDHVWFRPAPGSDLAQPENGAGGQPAPPALSEAGSLQMPDREGIIEQVEPRHGLLTRSSRNREHVLVANVDQVVFVLSLVAPALKIHLVDRYLASAAQGGIQPILVLNKADLTDPAVFQPILGLYCQLGIPTFITSAATGRGVDLLREQLRDRQTVFSGQSGVGKSSLLNAIQPGLGLRVREVSDVNSKGKHTTTTSELIRLNQGGWVVDTPGVRQFELWNTLPEEVEVFFVEFHPWVTLCAFPDCTHTHEERCAVKRAVRRRLISTSRYVSYLGLFRGGKR